ncbi:hypothetical protein RYX36_028107, partial [Vicia faba]
SLTKCFGGQVNGMVPDNGFTSEGDGIDNNNNNLTKNNKKGLVVNVPCSPSSSGFHPQSITMLNNGSSSNVALRIVAANHVDQDIQSDVVTSLYLLCCILRIVKIKDLANTIVAALYYPLESLTKCFGGQVNGMVPDNGFTSEGDGIDNNNNNLTKNNKKGLVVNVPCSPSSSGFHPQSITMLNNGSSSNVAL